MCENEKDLRDYENKKNLKDYEVAVSGVWKLAEIRFKLLALVPSVSGMAIGIISLNNTAFTENPLPRILIGLFGFFATIGIIFYDQRNSQIYNALLNKCKKFEIDNNFKIGQFNSRPKRTLRFINKFKIWHDRGLSLIYGSSLGGWIFLISYGICLKVNTMLSLKWKAGLISTIAAILGACFFIYELHRLDKKA